MFKTPELCKAEMAALLGAKTVTLDRESRAVTIEGHGFNKAPSPDKEGVLPIRLERLCAEANDAERPATRRALESILFASIECLG